MSGAPPSSGIPDPGDPPAPGTSPEPETPTTAGSGANGRAPEEMTMGELVFEISDRASVLIREEIELAKTEVTEKANTLLRGGVVGIVAGVFLVAALMLIMHGVAWLLNDLVFDNFWAGFFVEAVLFLLIAAGAGYFAYRSFQAASPPTPDMAIEQAKEIRASFEYDDDDEEGS